MKTCHEKSSKVDTTEDMSRRRSCQYKKILELLLKLKSRLGVTTPVENIISSDRFSVYTSYHVMSTRLGIEMLKPPIWRVSSYRV